MLKAVNKKTFENVLSYEYFVDKDDKFICPFCKEEVIFVDAIEKIKHFRHYSQSECSTEPETYEHIEMKKFMIEKLNLTKENIEVDLIFAKPDLFIPEKKLAIEVQHSPISENDFIFRTKRYAENNVFVLWIFDISLLNINNNVANVSALLKKAHEIYFGQVYFYKEDSILPIHFLPLKRYVPEFNRLLWQDTDEWRSNGHEAIYETVGGYETFYRNRKKVLTGNEITNFEILCTINTWKNNNWKIGRFYSKKFW